MPNYISKIRIPDATAQGGYVEYDIKDEVARQQLLLKLQKEIVQNLPSKPGTAGVTYLETEINDMLRTIYLVQDPEAAAISQNVYVEWVLVNNGTEANPSYEWEKLGTTETDFSNFSEKGHTHEVTPETDVADHEFIVSATVPAPTFTGSPSSLSGASGTINDGNVRIDIGNDGTPYTPNVTLGGYTESGGSHSHTIKKEAKYLKIKHIHETQATGESKAAKITSTQQDVHLAKFASNSPETTTMQNLSLGNPTQATVNVTPSSTVKRADGTLDGNTQITSSNEGDAVFNSASVSNDGVLSFGRKLLSKADTFGGVASATVQVPNITKGSNVLLYQSNQFAKMDTDIYTLETFNAAKQASSTTDVADCSLANSSDSDKGDQVIADIGGSNGSDVSTSTHNGHQHGINSGSGGSATANGAEVKLKGTIQDGSVTIIGGTVTPSGTIGWSGNDSTTVESSPVRLAHNVNDHTVTTSPDRLDESSNVFDWYGLQYNESTSNPDKSECRIGNMDMHRTLPIQSRMRRCLLRNDGTVYNYLDPKDSRHYAYGSKDLDGNDISGLDAELGGTARSVYGDNTSEAFDAQVMVEIPRHWRKVDRNTIGGYLHIIAKISPYEQEGWHEVKRSYVSAFEASVIADKLSSVSDIDGYSESMDGDTGLPLVTCDVSSASQYSDVTSKLPSTNKTLGEFREYARARNTVNGSPDTRWNCMAYKQWIDIFWLYVIEYANLDSQADFVMNNNQLGYKQGGLGLGFVNLTDAQWSEWGYSPIVPCGVTAKLGDRTGVVLLSLPSSLGGGNKQVNSYRGIELPFGHVRKVLDGVKAKKGLYNTTETMVCHIASNPSSFNSNNSSSNYINNGGVVLGNGFVMRPNLRTSNGWNEKTDGDIFPNVFGNTGSDNTYYCDSAVLDLSDSPENDYRMVAFGGHACLGKGAGLMSAFAAYGLAYKTTNIGTRLSFID